MFVVPFGWIPASRPARSWTWPSGSVFTTQWALSSKATTPSSSRAVSAAAGPVRLGAADHHQAAAEVADVDLQRAELAIGEAEPGHVDEDDAVVRHETGEVGRQGLRDRRIDVLALGLEGLRELGADVGLA